jgi:hypothetical protein
MGLLQPLYCLGACSKIVSIATIWQQCDLVTYRRSGQKKSSEINSRREEVGKLVPGFGLRT